MPQQKYIPHIQKINLYLQEFNSLLNPSIALKPLYLERINDQNYFLNPTDIGWDDVPFPNGRDDCGVYFYMGTSETATPQTGIYIGKASLSSKIGKRLYSHFKPKWPKEGKKIFVDDNTGESQFLYRTDYSNSYKIRLKIFSSRPRRVFT